MSEESSITYGENVNGVMNATVGSAYVAAYFREHMLMDANEMERARSGMVALAKSRGLEIDGIFIEHLETVPDAFASMVDKFRTASSKVLIIPGVHHLAGMDSNPLMVLEALKDDGVEVIFAAHVE